MNTVKQYQYHLTQHYQWEQRQKASLHRLAYETRQSEKYVSALPNALERLLSWLARHPSPATVERRQLRLRRRTT